MRHKSVQTTLRYAHLAPEHMDDALAALDSALSDCHSCDTSSAASAGDTNGAC